MPNSINSRKGRREFGVHPQKVLTGRAARRKLQREGKLCKHGLPKKTDGAGNPICPYGCGFQGGMAS